MTLYEQMKQKAMQRQPMSKEQIEAIKNNPEFQKFYEENKNLSATEILKKYGMSGIADMLKNQG